MRFILVCALLLSVPQLAQAETDNALKEQRLAFKATLKKIQSGKSDKAFIKGSTLKDYPLYPYLEYNNLYRNFDLKREADVSKFIKDYRATPLAWQLQRKWLNYLYKEEQWSAYVNHYDAELTNGVPYQCKLAYATYKTGKKAEALKSAQTLWRVGHSQPKDCDPIFRNLKAAGKITPALILERYWLAASEGNLGLTRYLRKQLKSKSHLQETAAFEAITKKPDNTNLIPIKALSPFQVSAVAHYGFVAQMKKDRVKATEAWLAFRPFLKGDAYEEVKDKLNKRLAINLLVNSDPEAGDLTAKLYPSHKDIEVTEWRIRNALTFEKWTNASTLIDSLPEEEQNKEIWRYWKVIADYSSQQQDTAAYKKALAEIAKERSYYGFLAAELLDRPFQLNRTAQGVSPEALKVVSEIPSIVRARELYLLGMQISANREWNVATKDMTDKQKVITGYIALSWGWNTRAIIMAAQAKHWDELGLRFPRPYESLFNAHAKERKIDPVWALAIARQESAFATGARSHVGASGLMQLMPATAKNTAKKHKVKYTKQSQLAQPKTNIALGTAYLSEMYNRFNMNQAYASAAYNAGPHRVKRWLKARGHLPLDVWIETIPFKETRRYVQRVLTYKVIYQRMTGKPANLLSEEQLKMLAFNTPAES